MPDLLKSIGQSINTYLVNKTNPQGTEGTGGTEQSQSLGYKSGIAIMSGKELIEKMGSPPKNNILFFGHAIKTNSDAYKQALGGLKSYQANLRNMDIVPLEEFHTVKDTLTANLQDVIKGADAYLAKHAGDATKTGRMEVMQELRTMAMAELENLETLTPEHFSGQETLNLVHAVALRRAGITGTEHFTHDANDHNLIKDKSTDNFAKGGINTVSKLVYKVGDEEVPSIVKPLTKSKEFLEDGEKAIGMDKDNLKISARNQATEETARLLGLEGIVPQSTVIVHDGQAMLAMELAPGEEALGQIEVQLSPVDAERFEATFLAGEMDSLEGMNVTRLGPNQWIKHDEAARDIPVTGGDNPKLTASLQEQLLNLQLLDTLTGQVDRHMHNVFIQINGDTAVVTGIDNDMCFGQNTTNIQNRKGDNPFGNGAYCGPPPLMSRASLGKLMEIDPDTFASSLPQDFSPEERSAARGRVVQLQEHARKLEEGGFIVDDFETWRGTDPLSGETMNVSEFLTRPGSRNYVDTLHATYHDLGERGNVAPLDPSKHGEL